MAQVPAVRADSRVQPPDVADAGQPEHERGRLHRRQPQGDHDGQQQDRPPVEALVAVQHLKEALLQRLLFLSLPLVLYDKTIT